MSTIRDAEDALLDAKVEAETAIEEAIAEWYSPMMELSIGMMWAQMPPAVKQQLRKMNPQAVKQLETKLGIDTGSSINFGG